MEQNDVVIEIDLLKLIRALLKKAWLIILVAIIAGAAMFGYSKMSYVPSYSASSVLYVQGADDDVTYTSAHAATRIKTLVAFKDSQTMVDKVNQVTGLTMEREAFSKLVVLAAVNGSEMLTVTVTSTNPEEAVLLVNTVTDILPQYADMIYGENSLVLFERASEAEVADGGSGAVKKAVIGAVLGACMVCAVIVTKELYLDWKANNPKNA